MIQPWKVGDKVRFVHQPGVFHTITEVSDPASLSPMFPDPMVCIDGLPGWFAVHLFVAHDYPEDSIVPRPAPMRELFLTVPCEPAKGPDLVRPIHVSIVTTEDNAYFPGVPYVISRWKCPHCETLFHRAKSCRRHMGMEMNIPAGCPVLLAQDAARRTGGADRVIVTLTQEQYEYALTIGHRRHRNALKRGRIPRNGIAKDGPQAINANLIGALGEQAYSVWSGLPWTCAFFDGDLSSGGKPADFGNVDVKTAERGHMLVQKDDPPGRDYACAFAQVGNLKVEFCGWLNGRDAKQKQFWGDQYATHRPCYWVPVSALQSMSTLKI